MPHKNKNLEVFRNQIDSIDQQILDLLVERGHIVKQVTETKLAHQLPVFVPKREQEKTAAFKDNVILPSLSNCKLLLSDKIEVAK